MKIPWLPIGGLAAVWLLISGTKEPALAATPFASGATMEKTEAKAMSATLMDKLMNKGFHTVPVYVAAESATAQIVDSSGAGRNLVLENQPMTDLFLHFMWSTNAILVYNNFDPAKWGDYVAQYATLSDWIDSL